jgi:predicted helicase
MPLHSGGVQTKRDSLFVDFDRGELGRRIDKLLSGKLENSFVQEFDVHDSSSYRLTEKISRSSFDSRFITRFNYRPLDRRLVYYDKDLIGRPFYHTGRHTMVETNISMALPRQCRRFNGALVASGVSGQKCFDDYDINLIFPLYIYPNEDELQISGPLRKPNLDRKLYGKICKAAGIDPANKAGPEDDFRAATGDARPSEVKLFDYIYGVLHSPAYRAKFAEFLKIDFPRIPYPSSPEAFREISEKGEQLRRLHLMEPAAIDDAPYPYEGDSDDVIANGYPKYEHGSVWINSDQFFKHVPKSAWDFFIGGYQPAQKWLKDRRGRSLSFNDITHYQRIIKTLLETDRLMKEIKLPIELDAEPSPG